VTLLLIVAVPKIRASFRYNPESARIPLFFQRSGTVQAIFTRIIYKKLLGLSYPGAYLSAAAEI
jgi:hypothetical protein